MSTSAAFAATPNTGVVQIATANTNRDGSGTVGTLLTAGASGSRVERIDIKATGTTTAGMVRIYIQDASANVRLWKEVSVSALTPSATVQAFAASIDCSLPGNALWLPATFLLKASTHNAETFNLFAVAGNL